MSKLLYEAPLQWPTNRPTTPRPQQKRDPDFASNVTMDEALNYLEEEVALLQLQQAMLTTDIEHLRVDRLRKKVGPHTGAALHFKWNNQFYVAACDRWQQMEHNVYVLHLTLRQCRNMERWGVASMDTVLCMFGGAPVAAPSYNRTTSEAIALPDWMREMGLGPTATLEDATAIYHRRAKACAHDGDALAKLNQLMEHARKALAH